MEILVLFLEIKIWPKPITKENTTIRIWLGSNNFKIKKQIYKPDSVTVSFPKTKQYLIIYLAPTLLSGSIFLPFGKSEKPFTEQTVTNLLEISPHRVYLVSLQHYLYILSVALVLIPMNRDRRALPAMLLCGVRTFLLSSFQKTRRDDKAICCCKINDFYSFVIQLIIGLNKNYFLLAKLCQNSDKSS